VTFAEALAPRPAVLVPLLLVAGTYALGWSRLVRRAPTLARDARLVAALLGAGAVGLALSPPLDAAAHRLFSAHMIQHLLLVLVAAPSLVLAAPIPVALWGLPRALRRLAPRLLAARTLGRRLLRAATAMPVAWSLHAATVWLWHVPAAYEAALAHPLLHDVEHLTLFVTAVLFWWPVVDPPPHLRAPRGYGRRIVYLVLAAFQGSALGLLLALSPDVLYPSYGSLDDQAWGGVLMWAAGGAVAMLAILVLLGRFLGR
jgi:cytochrome c oxidase assembly factor CtaG